MHILVTGAGSFSGAACTLGLLERGHQVTAVIRATRGRLPEATQLSGKLNLLRGDLSRSVDLPTGVDAIVHAAGRSPAVGISADDIVRDNVLATRRLAEYAVQNRVKSFIYFSSLSVYGRINMDVVDEATPVTDPEVYGLSKRVGEELLAAQAGVMRSLAIRLPGIIGSGSVRNWLTTVLNAAREGREISVFNHDKPFNNAVHIADLVEFVQAALNRSWDGFDAVTIGAGGQMLVGDVATQIVKAFDGRSRIHFEASKKHSFLISSARASERYGYRPTNIADMLRRFVAENTYA